MPVGCQPHQVSWHFQTWLIPSREDKLASNSNPCYTTNVHSAPQRFLLNRLWEVGRTDLIMVPIFHRKKLILCGNKQGAWSETVIKIRIEPRNGGLWTANLELSLESLHGDRSLSLAWALEAVRCTFLSVLTAHGLLLHLSCFRASL